jgi:hypothetical protein
MKGSSPTLSFNRGVVSRLGLARIDVPRMRLAAAVQQNWMPRVLGSMMLRPGTEYIAATKANALARSIAYVRSATAQARLELTDSVMRVLIDDALVTRPAVTAAVSNGSFTTDIFTWTDASDSGGTLSWVAPGYCEFLGDGTDYAILRQPITVNEPNVEHAVRVVVARGPVLFRIGSVAGGEEYISETTLGTGTHSIAFTPTGNFHIQASSNLDYPIYVDSITVEAAGVLELPTPWAEADLPNLRWTISADVIYVCDGAHQQRKIERRNARSWSVVLYAPNTGPFRIQNVVESTTIAPSGLSGEVTLTATKGIFKSTHVGALFRIASEGQTVSKTISAQNTFSDPIKVVGTGEARRFAIQASGTYSATLRLQSSVGSPGSWVDVKSWASVSVSESYLDGQDDQTIYYRIGVKTGEYTSGTVVADLNYAAGSIIGVARVVTYTNPTTVHADVLKAFGATAGSPDWWEGEWSDYRGWPSAIALFEGRLWHAGLSKIWGSISDAYEDFDDMFEGDAGPISRSIGEGPVDSIHWLLPLGRLLFGTAINSSPISAAKIDGNNILAARSSSFDEPLTPTNFTLKNSSVRGVFVDRSQQRLYELAYDIQSNDYTPQDLSVLVPDLNMVGIAGVCVQMKPDIRIHCWRNDGTVGCLVFDRAENVICWVDILTTGEVEDVSVLPGPVEDQVYYIVRRTLNSGDVRYHEKWALESECTGQPEARLCDCHVMYEGSPATTIGNLSHLEGMAVNAWGWNEADPFLDDEDNIVGRDLGTFIVTSGQITGLAVAVTNACVGLNYEALYKSAKQAFIEALGSPLNQMKRVVHLGLVLVDTHYQGIRYGSSFEKMFDMTKSERIKPTSDVKVWDELETRLMPMTGSWDTDSRICLRAASPRPANVLAMTIGLETNSKAA